MLQVWWNGGSCKALFLAPQTINAETPILCFLHGVGQSANNQGPKDPKPIPQSIDVVCRHGSPPARWQMGDARFTRFIIVCPQLESRRPWSQGDALRVRQLIEEVQQLYGATKRRKLLTGFSNGGAGVFEFAIESENTRFWTALWSVAPPNNGNFPSAPPGNWPVLLHYGAPDQRVLTPNGRPDWLPENTPDRIYDELLAGKPRAANGHAQTCETAYADGEAHAWLQRVIP
jgi:poly(3-hydroxybutyrate) depolymerase